MDRHRFKNIGFLFVLVLGLVALALAFPHLVSAYHIEAAGRAMADPARAQDHLQRAIAWSPDNPQAYRLLARALGEQGKWAAAVEALNRYTELRPNNPLGHIELALAYEALAEGAPPEQVGDLEARSAEEWRRAGVTGQDLVAAGRAAEQAGRQGAGEWYERAIRLAPKMEEPYRLLSGTPKGDELALKYLATGEPLALEQAHRLRPSDLYVNYHLWIRARQAGDTERTATYRQALTDFALSAIAPTDERLLDYAAEVIPNLLEEGLWSQEQAQHVVSFLIWHYPQVDGLEELLQWSSERYPARAEWVYLLGQWHHRRGELDAAKALYRQAFEADASLTRAALWLARAAQDGCTPGAPEQAACEEAVEWYSQYSAAAPGDLLVLARLAEVCATLEDLGLENKDCQAAAARLAGSSSEEIERLDSVADKLWSIWLDRLSRTEPQYPVGQTLDDGWTLLGYDLDEESLIWSEEVDLLAYWAPPGPEAGGPRGNGWYAAGERWVQRRQGVQNLIPNGGFEMGLAGFPEDLYDADPATRQTAPELRAGQPTSVALLSNTAAYTQTSLISTWLPIDAQTAYLQAGWIKTRNGRGYLGRRWAGESPARTDRYSYAAAGVRPETWQSFAQVVRPPAEATQVRIRLLNNDSQGQVAFDNVLFIAVGLPGAQ